VVKYGYHTLQLIYSKYGLTPPVLLANKVNSATIALGGDDPDNPAVQHAVKSSTAGAIKLLQLVGSLLHHKDGEHGYQDRALLFMQQQKLELYNLDEPRKFPDVSNTRYRCYTYTAAKVVCFHGIIQDLVEHVVDTKSQQNHVELNVLKGLNCAATMTENVALALYGVSVSWPYMVMVCSSKDNPLNLLSLTKLHRKLPDFCSHIAANPHILLDPVTPISQLTIDGKPFLNEFLIDTIRQLHPEYPNLLLAISAMFSGCKVG
jgi:hypothetical protein